jgi:hypothetical protein
MRYYGACITLNHTRRARRRAAAAEPSSGQAVIYELFKTM